MAEAEAVATGSKILSLTEKLNKIYNEIIIINQTPQYYKKSCETILNKIQMAEKAVRNFNISEENYNNIRIDKMDKIRQSFADISQISSGFRKYANTGSVKEKFGNLINKFEPTARLLDFTLVLGSAIGIEAASKIEVSFANFLHLVGEVTKIYNEVGESNRTTKYKKISDAMLSKADTTVKILNSKENYINYINFCNLAIAIGKIRQLLAVLKGFLKYFLVKDVKEKLYDLIDEFESTLGLLQLSLIIYLNTDDYKEIKIDIEAEEWIKMKIEGEDIKYFEYSEFSEFSEIGKGGFGVVNRVITNDGNQAALKRLINRKSSEIEENDIKEFVKELKLLRMVDSHSNINRFLGITKSDAGYIMVLEYANEGNLRDYLTNEKWKVFRKKNVLEWKDKIQMALDITCGLKHLHSKDVIHRDLHSKNILVNNGELKIADFGLSKKLTEITINSKANGVGMVEYSEPQCFKVVNYKIANYTKDKRSDIYSLGVLLWEITSGRPPFDENSLREMLGYQIGNLNLREDPIKGTPPEYQQLYQKCWDSDPEKRPDIDQIGEILNKLSQFNTDDNNSLFKQSDQSDQCTENEKINSSNTQTNSSDYYLSDFL